MTSIDEIQRALRDSSIDAWLFCHHPCGETIAHRILGLRESVQVSRRWFYLVPAYGDPEKLLHKLEPFHLDSLPGPKRLYAAREEFVSALERMLSRVKKIAMQFSPNNMIFSISIVDAGTVDLIRSFGKKVLSSAQLVALFEGTLSPEQISSHFQARDAIDGIMAAAFSEIGRRARDGGTNEHEIQAWVLEAFRREDLFSNSPPMIAVNANSSKPHYSVSSEGAVAIREGDFVLLDFWGKKKQSDSVYYDISWAIFVGKSVPDQIGRIFDVVRRSRDQAIKKVETSIHRGQRIRGWEVDKAARDVLDGAGLGQFLCNRVGHSIGTEVHGNGANIDNFESFDDRELLPNTCFSIEPGVYLPEFGLRSEVNLLIRNSSAQVTGKIQNEMVLV